MFYTFVFRLATLIRRTLDAYRLNYYGHLYPRKITWKHPVAFGKDSSVVILAAGTSSTLRIGNDVVFRQRCTLTLDREGNMTIGENNFFNNDCAITCLGNITIGNHNLFGENVKLYDHNHEFRKQHELIQNQGFRIGKITIGNNCWFGSNCVILNNVSIGDNVVVGANVVVRNSIPSNSLVRSDGLITVVPLLYKNDESHKSTGPDVIV